MLRACQCLIKNYENSIKFISFLFGCYTLEFIFLSFFSLISRLMLAFKGEFKIKIDLDRMKLKPDFISILAIN
jgi:hypothetical protein